MLVHFYQSLAVVLGIVSVPVASERGHFFMFWKTTSLELIPRTQYLQAKLQSILSTFFSHELVNVTSPDDFSSMDVARDMYDTLRLSPFPSEKVLQREKKKPFYFIRSLIKENWRGCEAYSNVLTVEQRFRCSINDSLAKYMCTKLKLISKCFHDTLQLIKKQLTDFFLVKTIKGLPPVSLEKNLITLLNESTVNDENERRRHANDTDINGRDIYFDDMGHLDGSYDSLNSRYSIGYQHRNNASVAALFGFYHHMQETEAVLKYALKELEPSRERTKTDKK